MPFKLFAIVSVLLFSSFAIADPAINLPRHEGALQALDRIQARHEPDDYRRLTAVTRRSSIAARSGCFKPKTDHELHYVDEESLGSNSQFAAQVKVKAKYPTLALEDIEPHVEDIQCSKSTVILSFGTGQQLDEAKAAWAGGSEFLIISAHIGCNEDGERTSHVVSRIQFIEAESKAELFITPVAWEDMFRSITVDFGSSNGGYTYDSLRRHDVLRRRQFSFISQSTTSTTGGVAFSRAYPTAPATATAAKAVSMNLTSQLIGKPILPPEIPFADQFIPQGISLTCKNCSVAGGLQLTQGSFSVNSDNSTSNTTQSPISFFKTGYISVASQSLSAHIELLTAIEPSGTLKNFTTHLPPIPLSPFGIPGIATVGPYIDPQIIGSIKVGAKTDFTYGFDVTVPNNSSVTLNIGDVDSSTTQGFDKSKIVPLPFQASSSSVSLNFSLGFHPELLLGIKLLPGSQAKGAAAGAAGSAGAGIFLDLPKLVVEVSQVTSNDNQCTPTNATATGVSAIADLAVGNLTHIVPSVELAVGVLLEAAMSQGALDLNIETEYTALATTYTLPTACLSYDKAKSIFGPANPASTPTNEVITKAASAASTGFPAVTGTGNATVVSSARPSSGGAAGPMRFEGKGSGSMGGERKRVIWSAVAVVGVAAVFAML